MYQEHKTLKQRGTRFEQISLFEQRVSGHLCLVNKLFDNLETRNPLAEGRSVS